MNYVNNCDIISFFIWKCTVCFCLCLFTENRLKCNSTSNDGSVNVSCSVVYAGNRAPVAKCEQESEEQRLISLQETQIKRTKRSENNVLTSTWNFSSKKSSYVIICSNEFQHSDRPRETIVAYSPLGQGKIGKNCLFLLLDIISL